MPLTHKHNWRAVGSFPDRYTYTEYTKCATCGKVRKRTKWWPIGSHGGAVCAPASNGGSRKTSGQPTQPARLGPTDLGENHG